MKSIRKILVTTCLALVTSAPAWATPTKATTSLPLDGTDLNKAKQYYRTQSDLMDFATFIKGLDVLVDHANPADVARLSDRSVPKKYFVMPFLQPREADGVVGAQEIATEALKLVASTMDLVDSFDLNVLRLNQINDEIRDSQKKVTEYEKQISEAWDEETRTLYRGLRDQYVQAIVRLEAERQQIITDARTGANQMPLSLRQEVVNQIRLKLSFLGVYATAAEQADFASNDPARLVNAATSMIARATNQGQYAIRQVVFKSGYTPKQMDYIAKYRLIRPDVQVGSLVPTVVYARSTALSVQSNADYTFGGQVNAPRLINAVNGGSGGRCGNVYACVVTMDLTFLGASMAQTSKSGALVIPVTFEADITVRQPDFVGSVWCNFQTGWQVKGRADVKDGAIIYDGDVYNQIKYHAFEDGSCNYSITRGSADSAAYHTIKRLYDRYMTLKMERGARADAQKEAYRQYVERELQWHADQSQGNNDFDFWSLSTWSGAFGPVWGTVASFVVGGSRNFYWHTRIEDQANTDAVSFHTSINESNIDKLERFTFDGNPIVCWRGMGFEKYIGACPAAALSDYEEDADHDAGWNQELCGAEGVSADCLEAAEEAEETETTDENGVTNPWG